MSVRQEMSRSHRKRRLKNFKVPLDVCGGTPCCWKMTSFIVTPCFLLIAGRNLLCSMSTYLSMFTVTVWLAWSYCTNTPKITPNRYFSYRHWLFHMFVRLIFCRKSHVRFVRMAPEMEVCFIIKENVVQKILVFFNPGQWQCKIQISPSFTLV